MVCSNTKELLAEIKKLMNLQGIQAKEVGIALGKSSQSVSQFFKNGNPNCDNLYKICDALNIKIDIYIDKNDTKQ